MYYSNKRQLFCTREQSAGHKRGGGMICELVLKPINNDEYDEMRNKIETDMRVMDSIHY